MAISLIDKIKPKNNGSFAMVDAQDVDMGDGKRLPEALDELQQAAGDIEQASEGDIDALFE